MRILVTGSSGFFGAHLVEKLISEGHNVSLFQRNQIELILGKKNFQGDILDFTSVDNAIKKATGC